MTKHIIILAMFISLSAILGCKTPYPAAGEVKLQFVNNRFDAMANPRVVHELNFYEEDERPPADAGDLYLFRIRVDNPKYFGRKVTLRIAGETKPLARDIRIDPLTGYSDYLAFKTAKGDAKPRSEILKMKDGTCRIFYVAEPSGLILEASLGDSKTEAYMRFLFVGYFDDNAKMFRRQYGIQPDALIPIVEITSITTNQKGNILISGRVTDCLQVIREMWAGVVTSSGVGVELEATVVERANPKGGPFVSEFSGLEIPQNLFTDGENHVRVSVLSMLDIFGWDSIEVKVVNGVIVDVTNCPNNFEVYYETHKPDLFYLQFAAPSDTTDFPERIPITITSLDNDGKIFDKKCFWLARIAESSRIYRSVGFQYAETLRDFKGRPADLSDDVPVVFAYGSQGGNIIMELGDTTKEEP